MMRVRSLLVLALLSMLCGFSPTDASAQDQKLVEGTVPAADFYSSALVDQINRFDREAVIRQAKEYKF
jgi:hypothetical protein